MQAIVGPESAFDALLSQLILHIYAAMNRLGGGAKTEFAPGRGKPQVRHCFHQLILRIYAAMNRLGGGAKTEFAPGCGKSPGAPQLVSVAFFIEG